eukprot:gene8652-biopygen13688
MSARYRLHLRPLRISIISKRLLQTPGKKQRLAQETQSVAYTSLSRGTAFLCRFMRVAHSGPGNGCLDKGVGQGPDHIISPPAPSLHSAARPLRKLRRRRLDAAGRGPHNGIQRNGSRLDTGAPFLPGASPSAAPSWA